LECAASIDDSFTGYLYIRKEKTLSD